MAADEPPSTGHDDEVVCVARMKVVHVHEFL
jgi:hypothetical protein